MSICGINASKFHRLLLFYYWNSYWKPAKPIYSVWSLDRSYELVDNLHTVQILKSASLIVMLLLCKNWITLHCSYFVILYQEYINEHVINFYLFTAITHIKHIHGDQPQTIHKVMCSLICSIYRPQHMSSWSLKQLVGS